MKKQYFVGLLAFVGVAVGIAVFAAPMTQEMRDAIKEERAELRQEAKDARDELKEERNEFREAKKEEIKQKRCERWQNRIQTRIKRYENKQQQHQTVFGNMIDRLKKSTGH